MISLDGGRSVYLLPQRCWERIMVTTPFVFPSVQLCDPPLCRPNSRTTHSPRASEDSRVESDISAQFHFNASSPPSLLETHVPPPSPSQNHTTTAPPHLHIPPPHRPAPGIPLPMPPIAPPRPQRRQPLRRLLLPLRRSLLSTPISASSTCTPPLTRTPHICHSSPGRCGGPHRLGCPTRLIWRRGLKSCKLRGRGAGAVMVMVLLRRIP